MKQVFGYFLILIAFGGLIAFTVEEVGVRLTAVVWGSSIVFTAIIVLGVNLVSKK